MSAPLLQLYERGLKHHEAGELQQAEAAFRQALAINPRHAESIHRLGYIAWQVGQNEAAARLFAEALKLQPRAANFHLDMGNALLKLGRLADAEASYREALKLRGRFPEACANLSALLSAQRRFAEAEEFARKAVRFAPQSWQAQTYLAHALRELGRIKEAEPFYRKAAELQPQNWEAHNNLGNTLVRLGRPEDAIESYRTALRLNPDYPDGHSNLGCALKDLERLSEAEESFRTAIRLKPDAADAHNNLGCVLKDQDRPDEAEEHFRTALRLRPEFAEAHNNLGIALVRLQRLDEAETCYRAALRLRPDYKETHNNLADIMMLRGRTAEAEACCRAILESDPDFAPAYNTLGNVLKKALKFEEAIAAYRAALERAPDQFNIRNNLGSALAGLRLLDNAIDEYEEVIKVRPSLAPAWRNLLMALVYNPRWTPERSFEKHAAFGRAMTALVKEPPPAFQNNRDPNRRIRVGWLSSDFRTHPVGRNIELMFANFDRKAFEIICYADVAQPDEMTARFRAQCDLWRSIGGKDDAVVAKMIRDDRIDIVIYLAGRFDDNRPQIAAWRPAPIQISFLDAATSGLKEMDYLIADPVRVPAHPVEKFTERILRLPNFYVHRPPTEAPAPATPAEPRVTFGCFNNPGKLNRPVMDLWGQILRGRSDSRLQLRYLQLYTVESFRKSVLAEIDPDLHDRVDLCGPIYGWANHLSTYNDIDIALDAFPFNGSTTTFEALWMGVPVVTLLGDTLMSRWTASMLTQVGLDDLIARSPEEYVEIALKLAADRDRLAELRATLRDRVAKSLLCDGVRTTRYFERALRAVWRKWCRDADGGASSSPAALCAARG